MAIPSFYLKMRVRADFWSEQDPIIFLTLTTDEELGLNLIDPALLQSGPKTIRSFPIGGGGPYSGMTLPGLGPNDFQDGVDEDYVFFVPSMTGKGSTLAVQVTTVWSDGSYFPFLIDFSISENGDDYTWIEQVTTADDEPTLLPYFSDGPAPKFWTGYIKTIE